MRVLTLPIRNGQPARLSGWRAALMLITLILAAVAARAEDLQPPIRIGLTTTSLQHPPGLLADWQRYMEHKLQRRVVFVQRDSYRETMDLLRLNSLDFAWICDYPYIFLQPLVRLLAVPVYHGRPYNRAYLIVPADDLRTTSILQLRDRVFAYADPYSTTGYLSPRYELHQAKEDSERFFRKTFFTWSHRRVVDAVASGLAQGGSVDSYVWDSLAQVAPELTARTRIVAHSAEYGFPPLVARRSVADRDFERMQRLLFDMNKEPEGAQLLKRLNLDGFTAGKPTLYNNISRMMKAFGE